MLDVKVDTKSPSTESETTIEKCRQLIADDLAGQAIQLAEGLIKNHPDNPAFWNILGVAYKHTLQWKRAESAFRQAVAKNPSEPKYRANLALALGKQRQYPDESEILESILEQYPEFYQAWVNLAQSYEKQCRGDDAQTAYKRALQIQPDLLSIRISLASSYMRIGNWSACCEALQQAVDSGVYCAKSLSIYCEAYDKVHGKDKLDSLLRTFSAGKNIENAQRYAVASVMIRYAANDEAVSHLEVLAAKVEDADQWVDCASLYRKLGQLDTFETLLNEALSVQPCHAKAWEKLAKLMIDQQRVEDLLSRILDRIETGAKGEMAAAGNAVGLKLFHACLYEQAVSVYQRTVLHAEGKQRAKAMEGIGMAFLANGKYTNAQSFLLDACKEDPTLFHAPVHLANCFEKLSLHDRARALLNETWEKHPENITVMSSLVVHYLTNNCLDSAEDVCDQAIIVAPNDPIVVAMHASILERQKKFQEAYARFDSLPSLYQSRVDVLLSYATVCVRLGKKEKAIALLERGLERDNLPPRSKASLQYRLGDYYDKAGEYDRAFAAYKQAADWRFTSEEELHINQFDTLISRYIRYFSAETLTRLPVSRIITKAPIFIVGMPRSGTTLTEQILASHSQIFGAGELMYIPNIVRNLPHRAGSERSFPHAMDDISVEHLDFAARRYMEEMQKRMQPGERYCIDKMPHNFMQIGLISRLFPDAKIVHCVRNPLDNCLSCYFQEFSGGHEYSYNLEVTGRHYRAYARLMDHWKSVNVLPILDVQYEELVSNPEPVVRKMLEFVGVEWEEECLNFHKSKRAVSTASYDQVRQPLYTKSAGRWRNYANYLEPLKKGLGVIAEQAIAE